MVGEGDVPLNVNFAVSEPPLGAATVRISALTNIIAMIRMQYEITNNVH